MTAEIDPFAFEEEDDTAKQLEDVVKERNRLGKLLREKDKRIAELEPLATQFQAREREGTLAEVFKAAGVDPKSIKVFTALNPEADASKVTKEQILSFASDNGVVVVAVEEGEEGEAEQEESEKGFNPKPTPPGAKNLSGMISRVDWLKTAATDPETAQAQLKAGKVDLSEVYAGLGPSK